MPQVNPGVGLWQSLGCYKCVHILSYFFSHCLLLLPSDSVAARVLGTYMPVTGQVSAETCTTACQGQGFLLAGMEYSDECCMYSFLFL